MNASIAGFKSHQVMKSSRSNHPCKESKIKILSFGNEKLMERIPRLCKAVIKAKESRRIEHLNQNKIIRCGL